VSTDVLVTIAGEEVRLARPASLAVCYEVAVLYGENRPRSLAAALGICWAAGGSRGAPRARFTADTAAYGAAVFDELVGRGLHPQDIFAAGVRAHELIATALPSPRSVDAVEGFSEGRAEASTS
jgi:hypothetical protein